MSPAARSAPQLDRDYYGELYIIVDDDGEPVSNYHTELHIAKNVRESMNPECADFRIAKVAFKAVGIDDPYPPEIVDDPRRTA